FSGAANPIAKALSASKRLFWVTAGFSLAINVLALASPLYMLQIYDRVLASGSTETLIALTVLILAIFAAMGLVDFCRTALLSRVGARLERQLAPEAFDHLLSVGQRNGQARNDQPLRDLKFLRQFIGGPGPSTVFDLPWAVLFIAIAFLMHW